MTVQLWNLPEHTSPLPLHNDVVVLGTPAVSLPDEVYRLSNDEFSGLCNRIWRHHMHTCHLNQCSSVIVQHIHASIDYVWRMVRQFDNPQTYKHFIRRCCMNGDGRVGSTRELEVVSGLPAASSTERLEILDEERHILSFKIVGGQHRLQNYHSVTTLHESILEGRPATIVIESYVVDVPQGNTGAETRIFADTIVKQNLQSLARKSVCLARHEQGDGKLTMLQ